MNVEWLLNEQPLYFGSRIHSQNDFGFITLAILGLIPEDAGTYTVRATNEKGQVRFFLTRILCQSEQKKQDCLCEHK